jgi:hypothetical protein
LGSLKEFGMVQLPWRRPDLRRDMAGIPKISGPQEREREMWKTTHRRNVLTTGMSTVPSGEPGCWDESELRPSTRVFEEMRERPQLCV